MFLKVNPSDKKPMRDQVIDQIRILIDSGSLTSGTTLPASRILAEKLGVSRFTIYQAYCELQAMGYLKSKPGSYNVVQTRRREAGYNSGMKSLIEWGAVSSENAEKAYCEFLNISQTGSSDKSVIKMAGINPDERLFPLKDFKRSIDYVLNNIGGSTLGYTTAKGYMPLREYIAQRLRLHGISVSSDEIIITAGAMNAIDLVLRLLVKPEKTVVIESPTYGVLIPLLAIHNSKITSVPMKDDGMDLNVLEKVLQKGNVSLVYTIPNFHNPTGITTNHGHREKLLSICKKYRVPILEDGFEEDLKYFGKVDLPIKSMDDSNIVIYTGTFSKALFPGLRLGWIAAAKECIDRLAAIKQFTELSNSHIVQAAMHHFCIEGFYDIHLKKLHRVYRRRMEVTFKSLEKYMPKNVTWTKPAGGFTLWIKMLVKLNRQEFIDLFGAYRIKVSPGTAFFLNENESEYFRISISSLNENEIAEGIKRIGKALHTIKDTMS